MRVSRPRTQRGQGRGDGAHCGALDEAREAHQEQPGHEEEDEERQDAGPQQRELLDERHPALLRRKHRAEMRLEPAADRDVDDEEPGHHEARKDAREPELPDRLARDHPVEHQHHARRDQDPERAAGLDDPVTMILS